MLEVIGAVLILLLAVMGAGRLVAVLLAEEPPRPQTVLRTDYDKLYAAYQQALGRAQATEAISAELYRASARLLDAAGEAECP